VLDLEVALSTRQQVRQRERALRKRGQAVLSAGLPQTPDKGDVLALTTILTRHLEERGIPDRASGAAALIHALNEVSARKSPGTARLACVKGCAHCCHSWVGVTIPEVLLLAGAIRRAAQRDPGLIAAIQERCRATTGLSPAERYGAKRPCPLLVDNTCSFYRERPSVCRQATSFDVAGCIDEFEGRGFGGDIKVSAVYLAHARNSRLPLLAALRLAGLDERGYELSAALTRVLAQEDAEARWLAGEDVMAGIAVAPRDPRQDEAVGVIAREVAALLKP
jgi:Fe-S-cluster containining protein